MRAVRIKAYQNMVSYRMPSSAVIKESYPLPPYSSVIGMVHAACGFQKYVPMQVSIQGNTASHVSELYTKYEFKKFMTYATDGRHNVKLQNGTDTLGMTRGMGNVELLTDVELVLHIIPEEDDMVDAIADGLHHPKSYLALGRWEDLIRIDDVQVCELQQVELDNPCMLPYSCYMPILTEEQIREDGDIKTRGTVYRLNKEYTISAKGFRQWTTIIPARFACAGSQIADATIWIDCLKDARYDTSENELDGIPYLPVFPA